MGDVVYFHGRGRSLRRSQYVEIQIIQSGLSGEFLVGLAGQPGEPTSALWDRYACCSSLEEAEGAALRAQVEYGLPIRPYRPRLTALEFIAAERAGYGLGDENGPEDAA
jgi:hypothetical protein